MQLVRMLYKIFWDFFAFVKADEYPICQNAVQNVFFHKQSSMDSSHYY